LDENRQEGRSLLTEGASLSFENVQEGTSLLPKRSIVMNMKKWAADTIAADRKKALPILSFPGIQLLGKSVKEVIDDSDLYADGLCKVADRLDMAACVTFMDLSLEAECFGSRIRTYDSEVPTVLGSLIEDEDEAEELEVPSVGSGRTNITIDAVRKTVSRVTDRPVFAGVIGPFSLAGRLMGVSEAMINCLEEPDMVHITLKKATEFLTAYCRAFKEAGANGIVLAEPLAGVLSPALAEEFSAPYCKEIVDAVQSEDFLVMYHNCGESVPKMAESIASIGAMAYHFGNAVSLKEMLEKMPADVLVLGNVDPAGELRNGTPGSVKAATLKVLEECHTYPNFIISTGCDVPPAAGWNNIDAFFEAVAEFYK